MKVTVSRISVACLLLSLHPGLANGAARTNVWGKPLSEAQIQSLVSPLRRDRRYNAEAYLRRNEHSLSRASDLDLAEAIQLASKSNSFVRTHDEGLSLRLHTLAAQQPAKSKSRSILLSNDFDLEYRKAVRQGLFRDGSSRGQQSESANIKDLLKLYELAGSPSVDFKELSRWANSKKRQAYLYRHLELFKKGNRSKVVAWLERKTGFFDGARKLDTGGYLTYGLEKEDTVREIADWFRLKHLSDAEWFRMPIRKRDELLQQALQNDVSTEPTARAPKDLASLDKSDNDPDRLGYEMRTGLPETKLSTIQELMDHMTDTFDGEAYHVHIVFDAPKALLMDPRFKAWIKQVDDSLLLGAAFERSFPSGHLKIRKANPPHEHEFVSKTHTLGLRDEIYGESHLPGHIRIGLELRDISGEPELWKQLLERVSDGIANRSWEKLKAGRDYSSIANAIEPRLSSDSIDSFTRAGVPDGDFLATVLKEDLSLTPLHDFSAGDLIDFSTGRTFTLSDAQNKRLQLAREKYLNRLTTLIQTAQKEAKRMDHEEVSEIVLDDTRIILKEWIKESGVLELFETW